MYPRIFQGLFFVLEHGVLRRSAIVAFTDVGKAVTTTRTFASFKVLRAERSICSVMIYHASVV
jgi:hypothetical protein